MKHSFAVAALVACAFALAPHAAVAQTTTDQTVTAAPGEASPMASGSPMENANPSGTMNPMSTANPNAQPTTPAGSISGAAAPATTSSGGSWGLVGLIGLLGLIGLRRRTP